MKKYYSPIVECSGVLVDSIMNSIQGTGSGQATEPTIGGGDIPTGAPRRRVF